MHLKEEQDGISVEELVPIPQMHFYGYQMQICKQIPSLPTLSSSLSTPSPLCVTGLSKHGPQWSQLTWKLIPNTKCMQPDSNMQTKYQVQKCPIPRSNMQTDYNSSYSRQSLNFSIAPLSRSPLSQGEKPLESPINRSGHFGVWLVPLLVGSVSWNKALISVPSGVPQLLSQDMDLYPVCIQTSQI